MTTVPVATPTADRVRGVAATTVAVVIWGSASVLVKAVDGLGGVGISFWRLVFGAVLLGVVFTARGGRIDRALLVPCIPGGIAFGADIVLFFEALRATSAANATIIGALQPILLLPFASRMFGERASRASIAWSLVAIAGTVLVVAGGSGVDAVSGRGDLLAVGALLSWTAYFVVSKTARQRLDALAYFTGLTIVSTALVVPYAFLVGADLSPAGGDDWSAIVAITVFSGALGHVLLNWSHGRVPLQVMSLLTLLVPIVATTGAMLFLDEDVVAVQWAGMAVVLGALAVVGRTSGQDGSG